MANIKSAIKRIDIAKKNTERNKSVKSEVKSSIRNFKELMEAGDTDKAREAFKTVDKKLKKAVKTGVMHQNKASRTLSQMAKMLNG